MTEDQLALALKLRDDGLSVAKAAAVIGVSENVLTGLISRRKLGIGRRNGRRILTQAELRDAIVRRRNGESWKEIAAGLGVNYKSLMRKSYAYDESRHSGPLEFGPCHASMIQPHKARAIRRIIKPPEVVKALAQKFAAGEITRAEFVYSLGAGAL